MLENTLLSKLSCFLFCCFTATPYSENNGTFCCPHQPKSWSLLRNWILLPRFRFHTGSSLAPCCSGPKEKVTRTSTWTKKGTAASVMPLFFCEINRQPSDRRGFHQPKNTKQPEYISCSEITSPLCYTIRTNIDPKPQRNREAAACVLHAALRSLLLGKQTHISSLLWNPVLPVCPRSLSGSHNEL